MCDFDLPDGLLGGIGEAVGGIFGVVGGIIEDVLPSSNERKKKQETET